MAAHFDDPMKQEIWATLRALNDAWTRGNPCRDMFFFVKESGRWRAVADQFSSYPAG